MKSIYDIFKKMFNIKNGAYLLEFSNTSIQFNEQKGFRIGF